jgi:hypothetical protein
VGPPVWCAGHNSWGALWCSWCFSCFESSREGRGRRLGCIVVCSVWCGVGLRNASGVLTRALTHYVSRHSEYANQGFGRVDTTTQAVLHGPFLQYSLRGGVSLVWCAVTCAAVTLSLFCPRALCCLGVHVAVWRMQHLSAFGCAANPKKGQRGIVQAGWTYCMSYVHAPGALGV